MGVNVAKSDCRSPHDTEGQVLFESLADERSIPDIPGGIQKTPKLPLEPLSSRKCGMVATACCHPMDGFHCLPEDDQVIDLQHAISGLPAYSDTGVLIPSLRMRNAGAGGVLAAVPPAATRIETDALPNNLNPR